MIGAAHAETFSLTMSGTSLQIRREGYLEGTMNLERGFRRLVMTISLAAASAGLLVTGYNTYKTVQYVSANKKNAACITEAQSKAKSWTDVEEADVLKQIKEDNPHLSDESVRLLLEMSRSKSRDCRLPKPEYPTTVLYEVPLNAEAYYAGLVPLIWGILVSTGLAAIPWGVFYLVRWIAHGFKE